jgi:L-alanine-DL-glutamate epimerase-like enolase superfamily enzyme
MIAEAAGLPVVKHCIADLGIGMAAGAHLIASTANCIYANVGPFPTLLDDVVQPSGLDRSQPVCKVPEGPGLGVRLDEQKLSAYAKVYADKGAFAMYGNVQGRSVPVWPSQ